MVCLLATQQGATVDCVFCGSHVLSCRVNARKSAVRAILKESKVVVLLWFAKDTLMLLFVGAPPAPSATCYVGGHPSLRWTSYHRL